MVKMIMIKRRRMIMMIQVSFDKLYDEYDKDDINKKMRSHFSRVTERVRDPRFSLRSTRVIELRLT